MTDPEIAPRRRPRLLFWLTLAVATGLLLLLLTAPLLDNGAVRLLTLFAQDATVQRTALASAVGLLVTAWVFFRSPEAPEASRPCSSPPRKVVGA